MGEEHTGVALHGLIVTLLERRSVGRRAQQLAPANVAKNAAGRVRASGRNVVGATREGRSAMKAKEAELKAARDGDAVVRVEPGQVIVLREVHVEQGRIEAVPVGEPDEPTAPASHTKPRRRHRH